MKKQIVILCLLFSYSCMSQKMNSLTEPIIQLVGKNTNIRDFLDIDGYYESDSTDLRKRIFFGDGTYGPISFKDGATKSDIEKNMMKWILGIVDKKGNNWGSYYYPGWGVYTIKSDTIFCQEFTESFILSSYYAKRYKIIDRKTIELIYSKSIKKDYKANYKNPWQGSIILHFIPADSLPSSDCWLKEKKWIWRNESDWKNYKDRIKQKKIGYKKK